MSHRYQVLANRIKQELISLEKVINPIQRAIIKIKQNSEDQDLFLDSVALNLHDFYTGLERIFTQIATTIDNDMPSGRDWHRELLNQMGTEINELRPAILSPETIQELDEYRRFRHVVRNVYGFEFDITRIEPLVNRMDRCFQNITNELILFTNFLETIAQDT